MIKEFTDNVQRLFDDIVTDRVKAGSHHTTELLSVLRCKATQPIKITEDASHAYVIYYNVSVTLSDHLSEMNIAYNSDYQMTFDNIVLEVCLR